MGTEEKWRREWRGGTLDIEPSCVEGVESAWRAWTLKNEAEQAVRMISTVCLVFALSDLFLSPLVGRTCQKPRKPSFPVAVAHRVCYPELVIRDGPSWEMGKADGRCLL